MDSLFAHGPGKKNGNQISATISSENRMTRKIDELPCRKRTERVGSRLSKIYDRLFRHFGPQEWWPGETPLEVCVGAILVQNTSWTNAAKAIADLKSRELLTAQGLRDVPQARLARLIRPARFFNVKARRLKGFIRFLWADFDGDLQQLFSLPTEKLRDILLNVDGIGPETADSILLYAAERPMFVVDAYTRRIFSRLGIFDDSTGGRDGYESLQNLFSRNLPCELVLFNEYHALLVKLGNTYCRPRPNCTPCPLKRLCAFPRLNVSQDPAGL